jgi:GGDEF domain-containing protein
VCRIERVQKARKPGRAPAAPYHHDVSYGATRRIIVAGGLAVLAVIAVILYFRRVDTVEVVAVLLFVPVFLAFVLAKLPGGIAAGVLAGLAYAALRLDAIDAVGAGRFSGLIATRAFGYLAFGALGGWAVGQLERSLDKLDLYDQIDDETGLYNARFFLQDTDLEMSRAERYRTLFSVAVVDVPAAPLDALPRRRRQAVLQDVGRAVHDAIRTVDRAAHARLGTVHRIAVICPETAAEGAAIFTGRLAESLATFLAARGVDVQATPLAVTFPSDDGALQRLRDELVRVEEAEHPEHPVTGAS